MAPNFFARGDTKTPVKYSIVVLLTNLCFSVILMLPFGHVGIAASTSIAAFVSLGQYIHGLKKRDFWNYPQELLFKTGKIFCCSVAMGIILLLCDYMLNLCFGNWLHLSILPKLALFALICILGFITFVFCAKLCHLLNLNEIISCLRKEKIS